MQTPQKKSNQIVEINGKLKDLLNLLDLSVKICDNNTINLVIKCGNHLIRTIFDEAYHKGNLEIIAQYVTNYITNYVTDCVTDTSKLSNLNYKLCDACKKGDIKTVGVMIKYGANSWHKAFYAACEWGHIEVAKMIINHPSNNWFKDWDGGLYSACKGGCIDIIEWLVRYYTHSLDRAEYDWNRGLRGACRGGHMNIVKMMIDYGADEWNWGLCNACEGGHFEIAELMIQQGSDDWNWSLYYACVGGNVNIVDLVLISARETNTTVDINYGLCGACERGDMELTKYMIEKGANDFEWGLEAACTEGHLEIVKLMIDNNVSGVSGVSGGIKDWDWCVQCACLEGYLEIVEFVVPHGAHDWNEGLYYACKGGNLEIVKYMVSKGANNWNQGLEGACKGKGAVINKCKGMYKCEDKVVDKNAHRYYINYTDIVEFMISKGANDWNRGLEGACKGGNIDLVNMMISKGANNWLRGLSGACQGNFINVDKITEAMFQKGLTFVQDIHDIDEIIDIMMNSEKFSRIFDDDYIEIVKMMISNGVNVFDWGIINACKIGHLKIAEQLMYCRRNTNIWDQCILCSGSIDIFALVVKNAGSIIDVNKYMKKYCSRRSNSGKSGDSDIKRVKILIKYGANDWNGGLLCATSANNTKMAELMIQYGASVRS